MQSKTEKFSAPTMSSTCGRCRKQELHGENQPLWEKEEVGNNCFAGFKLGEHHVRVSDTLQSDK